MHYAESALWIPARLAVERLSFWASLRLRSLGLSSVLPWHTAIIWSDPLGSHQRGAWSRNASEHPKTARASGCHHHKRCISLVTYTFGSGASRFLFSFLPLLVSFNANIFVTSTLFHRTHKLLHFYLCQQHEDGGVRFLNTSSIDSNIDDCLFLWGCCLYNNINMYSSLSYSYSICKQVTHMHFCVPPLPLFPL